MHPPKEKSGVYKKEQREPFPCLCVNHLHRQTTFLKKCVAVNFIIFNGTLKCNWKLTWAISLARGLYINQRPQLGVGRKSLLTPSREWFGGKRDYTKWKTDLQQTQGVGQRKADFVKEKGKLKECHDHSGRQLEERSCDSERTKECLSLCIPCIY